MIYYTRLQNFVTSYRAIFHVRFDSYIKTGLILQYSTVSNFTYASTSTLHVQWNVRTSNRHSLIGVNK
jgi:hypothetical protein